MRFLIATAAILAYASAGLIAPLSPLVYGVNHGDAQAAAIDATIAAQDNARLAVENHNNAVESHNVAAEQAIQHNSEALRSAADSSRNLHENAYWDNVAAAQTYGSALDGAAAGAEPLLARSVIAGPGLAYGHAGYHGAAPLAYGAYGAPLAYGAYGAPLVHGAYGAHLAYGAPLAHAW